MGFQLYKTLFPSPTTFSLWLIILGWTLAAQPPATCCRCGDAVAYFLAAVTLYFVTLAHGVKMIFEADISAVPFAPTSVANIG